MEIYPQFYLLRDGEEVEYDDLVCPKCGTETDDMHDEADTVLHCPCGNSFYHNIWDDEETLMKRHPEIYKK